MGGPAAGPERVPQLLGCRGPDLQLVRRPGRLGRGGRLRRASPHSSPLGTALLLGLVQRAPGLSGRGRQGCQHGAGRAPVPVPRTLGDFWPSTAGGVCPRSSRPLRGCRNPSTAGSVDGARRLAGAGLGSLTVEGGTGGPRLCSLDQAKDGWRAVTAAVDSGAEETVAPPGLLPC